MYDDIARTKNDPLARDFTFDSEQKLGVWSISKLRSSKSGLSVVLLGVSGSYLVSTVTSRIVVHHYGQQVGASGRAPCVLCTSISPR